MAAGALTIIALSLWLYLGVMAKQSATADHRLGGHHFAFPRRR
jgi:hypothetical protein